jgi:hypothetical protein
MNSFLISELLKMSISFKFCFYCFLWILFWSLFLVSLFLTLQLVSNGLFVDMYSGILSICPCHHMIIIFSVSYWISFFFFEPLFLSLCVSIRRKSSRLRWEHGGQTDPHSWSISEKWLFDQLCTGVKIGEIAVMLKPNAFTNIKGISSNRRGSVLRRRWALRWFGIMYGPIRESFTISAQMLTLNLCWNEEHQVEFRASSNAASQSFYQ